ncbi:uncharacterized protein N7483_009141 [Penicillium malachiteum]|uniref:uncharacterized protein n=1 Tax=Penicillium malachiteum TaxID=1324776 RepID=UPI0025483FC0|nr:uncharacterized protein N7483_009141 [Penicillium malachiteum]KAJ5721207.1 hypothetical protein N7483_009141 [Penicillium malachiteum]
MSSINEPKERDSTFYDSPYLAEHYDIFCEKYLTEELKDVPVYWEQLQKIQSSAPEQPFVVLDVGTGTGRILHGLAASAGEEGYDLSSAEFIGLEPSQDMLDRAAKSSQMAHVGHVAWEQGTALDLVSVPSLNGCTKKVSMLMWAVGSISHLHEPEQPTQFLNQVAKVLMAGTGRVIISISHHLAPKDLKDAAIAPWKNPPRLASRTFPDIVYQTTQLETKTIGHVQHDTREVLVIRTLPEGTEQVVEKNLVQFKGRLWKENELVDTAKNAGLELADTISAEREAFYIFKLQE